MPVKKEGGFTLIEVLVTLAILMFGLLGLAGLIVKGQRAAYEAYQRHQALSIVSDMAERMKANQSTISSTALSGGGQQDNLWIADQYVIGAPVAGSPRGDPTDPQKWIAVKTAAGVAPNCGASAVTCTRAQLVEYDLGLWESELIGVSEQRTSDASSIGGIINARGCIEGPLAAPSPPNTYRVSVSWQGDQATAAPTSSACGTGLYRDNAGNVQEATRRVVSIDVTIVVPL